ncbi:transposase, partial [Pseudomonas aeruginosa]
RRSYSRSFKAQVIQECAQPGASIANVALSHSLNANLVHKWIRRKRTGITGCVTAASYAATTRRSHWRAASAAASAHP